MERKLPILLTRGAFEHNPAFQIELEGPKPHNESVDRLYSIIQGLDEAGFTNFIGVTVEDSKSLLENIHSPQYFAFLESASKEATEDAPIIPFVHSYGTVYLPENPKLQVGNYIRDTYTPIMPNTAEVALDAAACAVAGADFLLEGISPVYALTRPPGHHAGREFGMGYCYLNNAAIATSYLLANGAARIAILDIDLHHGNGTQEIFAHRHEVLIQDIHAHPDYEYPYFSGAEWEKGSLPFGKYADIKKYDQIVSKALNKIAFFKPNFLIVSAGFDTHKDDPTQSVPGESGLTSDYYQKLGKRIAALRLPTLVIQEGGYDTKVLGKNVALFLRGLTE